MHLRSIVFAMSFAFSGCWTHYASLNASPTEVKNQVKKAETYYKTTAAQRGAFLSGCPADRVHAEVVASKPRETFYLYVPEASNTVVIDSFEQPVSIGVTACESRYVFQIMCGMNIWYANPERNACEVVQQGSQNDQSTGQTSAPAAR
jgi:hypothetical protein